LLSISKGVHLSTMWGGAGARLTCQDLPPNGRLNAERF
jgi:hypothetical protein